MTSYARVSCDVKAETNRTGGNYDAGGLTDDELGTGVGMGLIGVRGLAVTQIAWEKEGRDKTQETKRHLVAQGISLQGRSLSSLITCRHRLPVYLVKWTCSMNTVVTRRFTDSLQKSHCFFHL